MITAAESSQAIRQWAKFSPVIPVLVVDDVTLAKPLANAIVQGGLSILEVTLRTDSALDVIEKMSQVEGAIVAAGTVLTESDVINAKDAGADFLVSPGQTPALLNAARQHGMPLLPGGVTASEVMNLLQQGYDFVKFFPAKTSGGAAAIKAIGAPIPQVSFCPTGGISVDNYKEYLSLNNVICVGGSWIATKQDIAAKDWKTIEKNASLVAQG